MSSDAIVVQQLGKCFSPHVRKAARLLHPFMKPISGTEEWVLRDISFSVSPGESMGVLGRNGAGKSTLLRILAGAMLPTLGTYAMGGRIASVLELGLGFNIEMTGRDNAITNSLLLGIPTASIPQKLRGICDFSDLREAFDKPLHCYSSGMVARLAFAIAMHAEANILLLDEALAVGDLVFQHKCSAKLGALRRHATMLLASHNTEMLVALCDRVLWLDCGRVREIGKPRDVVEHYRAASYAEIDSTRQDIPEFPASGGSAASSLNMADLAAPVAALSPTTHSFGNGHAHIVGAELFSHDGNPVQGLTGGEMVQLVLDIDVHQGSPGPIVGFVVKGDHGMQLFGMNNETAGISLRPTRPGSRIRYVMRFRWPPLARGAYSISPAIGEGSTSAHQMCHWVHDAIVVTCEPAKTLCIGWLLGLPESSISEDIVHENA